MHRIFVLLCSISTLKNWICRAVFLHWNLSTSNLLSGTHPPVIFIMIMWLPCIIYSTLFLVDYAKCKSCCMFACVSLSDPFNISCPLWLHPCWFWSWFISKFTSYDVSHLIVSFPFQLEAYSAVYCLVISQNMLSGCINIS